MKISKQITSSLAFRLLYPIVLGVALASGLLFFYLFTSLSDFIQANITTDLESRAREIYNIGDQSLNELLHKGQTKHVIAVRIAKAKAQGIMEDYMREKHLLGIIVEDKQEIFRSQFLPALTSVDLFDYGEHKVAALNVDDSRLYLYHFDFDPWEWHILLFKNAEEYAFLLNKVKKALFVTLLFFATLAIFLYFFLRRNINTPLLAIIESLQKGSSPQYTGIHEFEFLARHIAGMMSNLHRSHDLLEKRIIERTAELEQSKAISESILNAMDDAICLINVENATVIGANRSFLARHGVTLEDLAGRRCHEITHDSLKPCAPPLYICPKEDTLLNGNTCRSEHLCSTPDGTQKTIEVTTSPIINESGRVYQVVHVEKDITARKKSLDDLRMSAEKLQLAISESMELAVKAELASVSKSEFLANMSHEIRTPLNGIIGMAELMTNTELNVQQAQFIKTMQSEATVLAKLINDILDFSKIEAGKMELESIPFDLQMLLSDFADSFALRMNTKKIHFVVSLAPESPTRLIGDPGRLRQILVNLTGNAFKFTPAGGEIVVHCKALGEHDSDLILQFSVKDTGIGIAADKQSLVFESFTQTDGSTTRKYGGTGLGTAISKKLVTLMQGEISMTSEEGKGSEFRFTVALRKQQEQPSATEKVEAALKGLKVLVVDKKSASRSMVANYLKWWGCLPVTIETPKEALALLRESLPDRPFDLVITDIYLEGAENGFDLATQIKKDPAIAGTLIVVLTLFGNRGDGRRCNELGIGGYLTKPINVDLLKNTIMKVLGLAGGEGGPASRQLVTRHSLSEEERRSRRILLVEDYKTNQQVAIAYLQMAGYQVILAENGVEAVAAVRNDRFDLILMDVQMPLMDGYQATEAIRDHETSAGLAATPIVAMTAHALQGDREKCLAVGMNDYLTKPLVRAEFLEIVETWTDPANAGAADEKQIPPVAGIDCTDTLERPQVMDLSRVVADFDGQRELVLEIVADFVSDIFRKIKVMQTAIADNDSETIRKTAHSIKGGAANIRAVPLAEAAKILEDLGKNKDLSLAGEKLLFLNDEASRLREFIESR